MIVTFYSYKGGVGRSMALANVAKWFEQQGLRVVMIDWDLEAPGLESFFATDSDREAIRSRLGLIDLLATYKDLFRSLPKRSVRSAGSAETARESFATVLSGALPPLGQLLTQFRRGTDAAASAGSLSLLPAGSRTGERFDTYAELVQTFDWARFYAEYDGEAYFDWMRGELLDPALADIVLVDSRTGVAEMSGVCTRQLADVVVSFCAPNDQNLQGVAMMARSFVREDVIEARKGRPIEQLMVGSRIDLSEGKPVDLFEARFREQLSGYLPDALRRAGTDFSKLRIPYVSAYAYSERLAVGEPDGVKALQDAYELLAVHIALLAPAGSTVKQKCSAAFQRFFAFPRVFISAIDAAAGEHVAPLVSDLEEAGILAVRADSLATTDTLPPDLIGEQSSAVVLVVTPRALGERGARETWRRLRAQGVPTYLLAVDSTGAVKLPAGFGAAEILNAERDFDRLTSALRSRAVLSRVPFLAPPPPGQFEGREGELRELKGLVGADPAPSVALVGLGGGGKTSLAKVLCNDDDVVDLFPDGILWVALGPQPDLRECVAKLVVAFEGQAAVALDLDEAERRLAEHLKRKRCLLVLDDVCDTGVLERFPRGERCALLLTTRIADVVAAAGAKRFEVGGLSLKEATEVLHAGLDLGFKAIVELPRLAIQLGRAPAALRLANTVLRADVARGSGGERAIENLRSQLERHGLDALGNEWPEAFAGFTLALERLSAEDRRAFPQLADLQPDVAIRLDDVHPADVAVRMKRYASVSLVSFDAGTELVTVPAITQVFARTLALRDERAEETRRASAAPTGFKIYLSYRRRDTADYAGRLSDRLVAAFGSGSVFRDVDSIAPGMDFQRAITEAIEEANVVIVLIGRGWMYGDVNDFVRVEIGHALQRDIPVIPVLVNDAQMPSELPRDLEPLLRRQALTLSSINFQQDVDRLIQSIAYYRGASSKQATPRISAAAPSASHKASPPRRRALILAAASVVVAVGSGSGFYFLEMGGPVQGTQAEMLFLQAEDSYSGRNEPKDLGQALGLYTQAADLGNASAQNALGRMYENGEGTQADISAALKWYSEAARQNHPDAVAALRRLKDRK